jgi:hypothetical protein
MRNLLSSRLHGQKTAGHRSVITLPMIGVMTREGWGSIRKRDQQPPKQTASRLVCPRTERR